MITIYLSSTFEDLKEYRKAVYDALSKVSHYKVIAMENYVATDQRPVDKCLKDVANAHIYVGLFGFRYGYVPPAEHNNPDGLSITELEFRCAKGLGKPSLIFVADEEAPLSRKFDDTWKAKDKGKRIKKLRDNLCTEKLASFFSSPHQLASLVQSAVTEKLAELRPSGDGLPEKAEPPPTITWDIKKNGSPYPGLLHFTRKFAPVFFGREAEVLEVLDRIHRPEGRFIIISGNSGTGKSSLVDAGVLPRLLEAGLPGDKSCVAVRMVPSHGAHPFDALKGVLQSYAVQAGRDPQQMGQELLAGPERFSQQIQAIVADGIDRDELVLFLDQMEELFTIRGKEKSEEQAAAFVSSLYRAVHETPLRVIATIRGDFLHHCHQHSDLLQVLNSPRHYGLGPLMRTRLLHDVIEKPAHAAGLTISPDLVDRLIKDVGSDPGNLALLAFVLQRLFMERENNTLSAARYEAFGGIDGAIADHVAEVEKAIATKLGQETLDRLPDVFQPLLVVNVDGQPTRRRALKTGFPDDLLGIVDLLIPARLLTTEGEGEESTVSVAHEKLFEAWPALARWIADNRDDLLMVRQAELEAREWEKHDFAVTYLWHVGRLKRLQGVIQHLEQSDISSLVRQFAAPQEILIKSLNNERLSHGDRLKIGQYMAEFGDPRPGVGLTADGLPDIDWVAIPRGTVKLEKGKGTFKVAPFLMARYPVTISQFQAFIAVDDGYRNPKWWEDIEQSKSPYPPRWSEANCPRETVSWYEAVAYCRWLTQKYREQGLLSEGKEIRLPTEWEWQKAATCCNSNNDYPWGREWDGSRCNSSKSGLNRTTAVGMYLQGTWPGGPLDLSGNVWEWCLNKYDDPIDSVAIQIDKSGGLRVIRGGSWDNTPWSSRAAGRYGANPDDRIDGLGFRLAQSARAA
ncbi:MAG: DUF4062 domain-containing protein [Desulfuromonadales bacterium]|nr:MAG: DUF4062 domain-containing protein [Desulfuromonadales bacterium]